MIKGVARFEKAPSNVVWKIGISSVSCANAMENLDAEMPSFDFDSVVIAVKNCGNKNFHELRLKRRTKDIRKFSIPPFIIRLLLLRDTVM